MLSENNNHTDEAADDELGADSPSKNIVLYNFEIFFGLLRLSELLRAVLLFREEISLPRSVDSSLREWN